MSEQPIATLLDGLEWKEIPASEQPHIDGDLYATHEGAFTIGDFTLRCYTLNNGARVFNADDFEAFFGGFPER